MECIWQGEMKKRETSGIHEEGEHTKKVEVGGEIRV